MKFSIASKKINKNYIVTAVAYAPSSIHGSQDAIIACDDKTLVRYDSNGEKKSDPIHAGANITSLSWQTSPNGAKYQNDLFLVAACSNGSIQFMKANCTDSHTSLSVEKRVKAHTGACLRVKWDTDGSSLVTSGEDGEVKVWSRTGHLRTKLSSFNEAVYGIAWGPKNESVLAAHGSTITIIQTQGQGKTVQWEAQKRKKGASSILLTVDWNNINNLIICGGEDCYYRIFDEQGICLYISPPQCNVITSVSWAPNGLVFAVGSFNTLQLCDQKGWTHSLEYLQVGSIMDTAWAQDSTGLLAACGNRSIAIATILEKKAEWGGLSAKLTKSNEILVSDNTVTGEGYSEHIHLPISPITIDVKETAILLVLSTSNFAAIGTRGITLYTYEGKVQSSPKIQGVLPGKISEGTFSMSSDTIAAIDQSDHKIIRLFDVKYGKLMPEFITEIKSEAEVQIVKLSQNSSCQQERRLVFVDKKNEMFICPVTPIRGGQTLKPEIRKLGTKVDSFAWNDQCDILVSFADSRMVTYFLPNSPYVDPDLLKLTTETRDCAEYGKGATILSFHGSNISVRRQDGAILTTALSMAPVIFYASTKENKWDNALKICRITESPHLWAALAGLALQHQKLDIAEIALSSIQLVDKVEQIRRIRLLPSGERRNAEILLYMRCPDEAISILLQARPPLTYRAIKLNIRMFRWEKALNIAAQCGNRSMIEVVLWYRKQFLDRLDKKENNPAFQTYFREFTELPNKEKISELKQQAKLLEVE